MATKQLSYSDRLRHPLWQRCRLEVMQRDNFTCQHCRSTENTLNVHHKSYEKGRDPWDYDLSNFITLCEQCHEEEHSPPIPHQNSIPRAKAGRNCETVEEFDEATARMQKMKDCCLKLGVDATRLDIALSEIEESRAAFLKKFPDGFIPPYRSEDTSTSNSLHDAMARLAAFVAQKEAE